MAEDIGTTIRRTQRLQLLATTVLYAIVLAALIAVWQDSNSKRDSIKRESQRTTEALCSLRIDLERRVKLTEAFLAQNPKGTPGIPLSMVKVGLEYQYATLSALSTIDCTARPEIEAKPKEIK